jgi:putative acetyltransferase
VRIAAEPFDAPESRRLRLELLADLYQRYGGDPGAAALDPDEAADAFLIARDEEARALGCVALRRYDAEVWELRRMYVRPLARGRGIGACLVAALEARVRARGGRRVILECGTAQPEAMALYRRCGYELIPAFGVYAGSPQQRCFGREI